MEWMAGTRRDGGQEPSGQLRLLVHVHLNHEDRLVAPDGGGGAVEHVRLVALDVQSGVPIPALSASLAYYDGYRTEVLVSAQCVQAQRDSFGAHGFMRLDRDGAFTADWGAPSEAA